MNGIQQYTDNHVVWSCSGCDTVIHSPSFIIKGVYCHICWEKKRLLLRTFGPNLWIKQLSCKLTVQVVPCATQSTNSESNTYEFTYTDLHLSTAPSELCLCDILGSKISIMVDLLYNSERMSPLDASRILSPSTYISGLTNQGKTCYINVVLQALFSVPKFRHLVITAITCEKEQCFLMELRALFAEMLVSASALRTAIYEEDMVISIGSNLQTISTQRFISFLATLLPEINAQGDAQEFILFMFDQLRKTAIWPDVHSLFSIEGCRNLETRQRLDSSTHLIPKDVIPQHDLFLSIPVPSNGKLSDSLSTLFEREKLMHNNTDTTATYTITRLPDILIVSFQRSIYDFKKASVEKDMSPIKFSKHLDLSRVQGAADCLFDKDSKYTLFSVITHKGSSDHGHYLAYILPYLHLSSTQFPVACASSMESVTLTDEMLVGPSCNSSLSEMCCYRINDSHVSSVDVTEALSNDGQKEETIYMMFYLRDSAFWRICGSSEYAIERIYRHKIQNHRANLKQMTALSTKQHARTVLVSSNKLINVSSDGIITISVTNYELPCFAGLEFLHNYGLVDDWSTTSIFPLSIRNDKILYVHKAHNHPCDTTWPISSIESRVSPSIFNGKDTVWYFTRQKASHNSCLFFLVLYLTEKDIALLQKLISMTLVDALLPSRSTLTGGCAFLGELIVDHSTKADIILSAKQFLVKYFLEHYDRKISIDFIDELAIALNIAAYYKKSHDQELIPIEQQAEPLTSGMLYLGLTWTHLELRAPSFSRIKVPSLEAFVRTLNDKVELILEPLEVGTNAVVGMHSLKLAGLFMMPLSSTVIQHISLYLQYVRKYSAAHYTFEIVSSSSFSPIKMMVSPKYTIEEIAHDLYKEIAKQPLVRIFCRHDESCVATINYKEIIDHFHIDLPECLQGEVCALNVYKYDAYIHEKVPNPANEHVVFLSETSYTGSSDSRGNSDVLHIVGLFTSNKLRHVTANQMLASPVQRELITIEDITKKVDEVAKPPSNKTLLSPTSLKRKFGFGPEHRQGRLPCTNLGNSISYENTKTIRLKYTFSRVTYSHIATIRPVRVLLVVHNIPIADLIIPMPREQGWQNIKLLVAQLRTFFCALFRGQGFYEYTHILSLADVNGCICFLLEDLNLSLLTIRGNPINTNGILRCDICEKRPDAVLYYKVDTGEYSGIGQVLTIDRKDPDVVITALHASYERANLFLDAVDRSLDMQATLKGYNPDARLLWVPQNRYSILRGELFSVSQSLTSNTLSKTEQSLMTNIDSNNETQEMIGIWVCRLQQKFSEAIPGDDKLLLAHTRAQGEPNL